MVFVALHQCIIPILNAIYSCLPKHLQARFVVLVADTSEGAIVEQFLKKKKIQCIRRPSDPEGRASALRQILEEVTEKGKIAALTLDEKGAETLNRQIKDGAAFIASRTDAVIFCVAAYPVHYVRLSTWDNLLIPVVYGGSDELRGFSLRVIVKFLATVFLWWLPWVWSDRTNVLIAPPIDSRSFPSNDEGRRELFMTMTKEINNVLANLEAKSAARSQDASLRAAWSRKKVASLLLLLILFIFVGLTYGNVVLFSLLILFILACVARTLAIVDKFGAHLLAFEDSGADCLETAEENLIRLIRLTERQPESPPGYIDILTGSLRSAVLSRRCVRNEFSTAAAGGVALNLFLERVGPDDDMPDEVKWLCATFGKEHINVFLNKTRRSDEYHREFHHPHFMVVDGKHVAIQRVHGNYRRTTEYYLFCEDIAARYHDLFNQLVNDFGAKTDTMSDVAGGI